MSWTHRNLMDHPERRRGQAMVIFALIFVVLVGFAGLSLDATHLYLVQHTAQKAADAAALAAGKRLAGATQQSPVPNSNDLAAVAAHDFAGADGFITTRNVACDTTVTSGSVTRFTTWWYDTAGVACGSSSGFNTAVGIAVPPFAPLTPHCQTSPYNCMQVMIQSKVQNFLIGTLGIPTTNVAASATVYAQPTGTTYDYPFPVAIYLYEPAVATIALCPPGQQCFDRTKVPARSLLSCSTAGSNCPTYWARPEASSLIVGVDGTTLNPPQDVVALESNGDMVMQGSIGDEYCDPYGVGVTGCTLGRAIGKGYAIAPGAIPYCATSGGAGTRLPTPCSAAPASPGGTATTPVYANETTFASHIWTPRVDTSGLLTCGTLLLNGGTVASSLSTSTCAPPAAEPYTVMPGKYDWIVVNHGSYSFEPGIYDITGIAPVNSNSSGTANGIDHSRETSADWDLCTTATGPTSCGGPTGLRAGVWIGRGSLNYGAYVATTYGACGGPSTMAGGGGDPTIINAPGVVFRFESSSMGFVSTSEVQSVGMSSPGLGQMRQVGGAPLLFDMENNGFIHLDGSTARSSDSRGLNTFSGIIYQTSTATAGGVEVNPGVPTREDGEGGGTYNNAVVGQVYAYSFTNFGSMGAFDYSSGAGGAATPTVTTSGNQENSILVSSVLQAGPTGTTESLVVKYSDEWALDAYDVYVKINANSPVYFSDGIWSPRPGSGATLPPNNAGNIPSDTNPRIPAASPPSPYTGGIDSVGDPNWTMHYPVAGIYGPADGSTFQIEGDWIWGHERDLTTAVRGNDVATLTYTFPVPAGQTVTISMFMTDGDRCGDYVTSTWTFNNIGTPAPGVQVVGSVRLEA
ncbi:MAG TPA: pilus assembly protein TadG-related protein [Candidatus Dormibacteraeota bacterium]